MAEFWTSLHKLLAPPSFLACQSTTTLRARSSSSTVSSTSYAPSSMTGRTTGRTHTAGGVCAASPIGMGVFTPLFSLQRPAPSSPACSLGLSRRTQGEGRLLRGSGAPDGQCNCSDSRTSAGLTAGRVGGPPRPPRRDVHLAPPVGDSDQVLLD